ncbi:MAG TPA: multidrug efflux SMR transporter [Candidatus Aphodovivens excrementavium]|nr:multidrug efflux SMR transporter [Candidatus Aphodovivens excrementavium]
MAWVVLILSGLMEAVWATALSKSEGFANLVPSIVFLLAMCASMAGLAYATKTLPIGTAYAVWTGIGAACTVVYAMATGAESASIIKIVLIAVLIGCVVGLKLVSDAEATAA